jgi:hypothetical protein
VINALKTYLGTKNSHRHWVKYDGSFVQSTKNSAEVYFVGQWTLKSGTTASFKMTETTHHVVVLILTL